MKLGKYEISFRRASKQELSSVPAFSSGGVVLESRSKPMLLSTVYRCVDLISDSVAVLPFKTYAIDSDGFKTEFKAHPAYHVLNLEPNEDMTRFVFMKALMASVLLQGNAYAYIERRADLSLEQLVYIPSYMVTPVWVSDKTGVRRKRYQVSGFRDLVEPCNMIHILNFSYDGIMGVSTLTHARQSLRIATDSETHAANFFRGGANVGGVLTIEGSLNQEQKRQNYEEWERRTDPTTGRPNGIVILGGNMQYRPISISPKDSQLLESRLFNVQDICRFFSVSPLKAFDLSKANYSTVEATQIEYLTDTALAALTKIELEFNRKVFLPSERDHIQAEFETSAILRADKKAQSEFWKNMFYTGAATPNEIRRENNAPRLENGDKAFVPVNVQPLDTAVTAEYKAPGSVKDREPE